jgi:Tfp pilus assembly protein PilO
MNKLSKEKRDKLLMVGVGTLMIVALWWNFVIGSQSEKLADYNRKITALRDKVDKAERLSRLETVIGQNLQASRRILDAKQESMAPSAGQRYWLLKLLDQFKKDYSVELLAISQPVEEELGVLPKFPFRAAIFGVKVSAQYHEFGRFVADFENAFPYLAIRNIKLEPEGDSSGNKPSSTSGTPAATSPVASEPGSERLNIEFRIVTLIKPTIS